MKKIGNLRELLTQQLKDLWTIEDQESRLLPHMMELSLSSELRTMLEKQQREVKSQLKRSQESFKILQLKPSEGNRETISGLITEANRLLVQTEKNGIRDAALVTVLHRIQYLKVAICCAAKEQAQALGYRKMVTLLQKTLTESTVTGQKILTSSSKTLEKKNLVSV